MRSCSQRWQGKQSGARAIFNPQELANTAWAFATADQKHASLFAELATAAQRRLGDFDAQNLANIAWAFATAD